VVSNQDSLQDLLESTYRAVNFVPGGAMTISRSPGKRERDLSNVPEGHEFSAVYVPKESLHVVEDVLRYKVGEIPSQRDLLRAYLTTSPLFHTRMRKVVVGIKCQNTSCGLSAKVTLDNQYMSYAEAYCLVLTQASAAHYKNPDEFSGVTGMRCDTCKSQTKVMVMYDECSW
jgi:hypothetical protein